MGDLTGLLPTESKTVEKIYEQYKIKGDSETARGYLGASIIGHNCERYLWYNFRFCCKPEFSGRMYRLFDTGDHEEERLVADLRSIGCEVHDKDENGLQFEIKDIGGHFSGHMDGCALGIPEAPKTWHVLEFKTHNNKSLTKLKKEGVRKAKPMHFGQMQAYMGHTGMKRALYLAVNKDTDELYSERVEFDKEYFDLLMQKAERVIKATEAPPRISNRPDWYECQYCDAKEICHNGENSELPVIPIAELNCRQCCHATPIMEGDARWVCEKHTRGLSVEDQRRACGDHLCLPSLIGFAEPTGSGANWIEFTTKSGVKFWHGNGKNLLSTKELTIIPASSIASKAVVDAKQLFGAEITEARKGIFCRYPRSDSRIVWEGKKEFLKAAWAAKYHVKIEDETIVDTETGMNVVATEYLRDRVTIVWTDPQGTAEYDAEIREGIS